MEKRYKVTFGGWFQRTTLHLSEVHGFFVNGRSKLELSKHKLSLLHRKLNFRSVSRVREPGNLEYVRAETKNGIVVKYYEDGLHILEKDSGDVINRLV